MRQPLAYIGYAVPCGNPSRATRGGAVLRPIGISRSGGDKALLRALRVSAVRSPLPCQPCVACLCACLPRSAWRRQVFARRQASAARAKGTVRPAGARTRVVLKMSEFVICINNDSNPASLIVGKVYRRLPDPEAESHNMLRIIDEDVSEPEGYLYPGSLFVSVELPEEAKQALMAVGS